MRAVRAAWRYRWEIAPFLLVGVVEGLPGWVFAVRNYLGLPFSPYTRWQHGNDPLMLVTGYALWLLPGVAAFVLIWYGIRRLDVMDRPVTKSLWSALLFVSVVLSGLRALYFFEGPLSGPWQESHFFIHNAVIIFGVAWAAHVLWGRTVVAALFVISATIVVRDAAGPWTLSVSNDTELLRAWLIGWSIVGVQLLLIGVTGVFAHGLLHQPVRRQWRMTCGLSVAASAVLVAVLSVQEVMGTFVSIPYWYARFFGGILEETGFLQAVVLNLVNVYALAALAVAASFGFHTLLPRHPIPASPESPTDLRVQ